MKRKNLLVLAMFLLLCFLVGCKFVPATTPREEYFGTWWLVQDGYGWVEFAANGDFEMYDPYGYLSTTYWVYGTWEYDEVTGNVTVTTDSDDVWEVKYQYYADTNSEYLLISGITFEK